MVSPTGQHLGQVSMNWSERRESLCGWGCAGNAGPRGKEGSMRHAPPSLCCPCCFWGPGAGGVWGGSCPAFLFQAPLVYPAPSGGCRRPWRLRGSAVSEAERREPSSHPVPRACQSPASQSPGCLTCGPLGALSPGGAKPREGKLNAGEVLGVGGAQRLSASQPFLSFHIREGRSTVGRGLGPARPAANPTLCDQLDSGFQAGQRPWGPEGRGASHSCPCLLEKSFPTRPAKL